MATPELIFAESSVVRLDANEPLAREPMHPNRMRSTGFVEKFEHKILYYDCFESAKGHSVILIGPPPLNLENHLNQSAFYDAETGQKLEAIHTISRSTLLTQIQDVPAETKFLKLEFGGQSFEILIQPNLSAQLSEANILFSMNKDNELRWVHDWAEWHNQTQNVDTIILFDNGSTRYDISTLGNALEKVKGLKKIVIFEWPFAFGARDNRVWYNHYWAHFLQISSMNVVLRRCAMAANGMANLDIDELAAPLEKDTIFDLTKSQLYGVAPLAGTWISAATRSTRKNKQHTDFFHVTRGPMRKFCPKKWVLDPQAEWVDKTDVFPYWHRIMGAPDRKVTDKTVGNFWHFKGISTNWKQVRSEETKPSSVFHIKDANFINTAATVWPNAQKQYQDDE